MDMQEDETVLSDVHILDTAELIDHVVVGDIAYRTASSANHLSVQIRTAVLVAYDFTVAVSRFPFNRGGTLTPNDDLINQTPPARQTDEDGDLDVPRRRNLAFVDPVSDVITIEHGLASPLRLVGLQVWLGAMLLSDYILHLAETLIGNTILELGAGTGLCSIVASIFSKRVICTDIGSDILEVCQRNVNRNRHLAASGAESILVRELDWANGFPPPWSSEDDLRAINDCDVILAADVIYDDHLTDSFFALLSQLLVTSRPSGKKRTLYLSLERRLNFTLSELEVSCPAYDHFIRRTETLRKSGVDVKKLPTYFRQRFNYKQNKYLELWEMSAVVSPDVL